MKLYTTVHSLISAAHMGPFHDRLHGHTYAVEARFSVEGAVRDAGELERVLDEVLAPLDHSTLDETLGRENSTCEGIAAYVFGMLRHLDCHTVVISRTDGSGALVHL